VGSGGAGTVAERFAEPPKTTSPFEQEAWTRSVS